MKNILKFSSILFLISFIICSCSIKQSTSIQKEIIYTDTNYIQIAISNKDDIQFFTMVNTENMIIVFNDALTQNLTNDEKTDLNYLIKNCKENSPNKPWEYNVSIDDTFRINKLIGKFKTKNIIPLNYDFSWSINNLNTSRISLFAYKLDNKMKTGFLTGSDISEAYKAYDEKSNPLLVIKLKKESSNILKNYTEAYIGLYYGVFIRNRLLVYRYINYEIDGGVIGI